eukprot:12590474-Prorocentrum_lima.AAC.1
MLLSLTNGKVETVTTTDISTACLHAPIEEAKVVLISPPHVLLRLGIVKPGTEWKIRKAIYGLKESPRLWQEGRDRVLGDLAWYSDHWKSN